MCFGFCFIVLHFTLPELDTQLLHARGIYRFHTYRQKKDTSADVSGTVISTSAATRTAHAKGVDEAVLPIPFGEYSIYGPASFVRGTYFLSLQRVNGTWCARRGRFSGRRREGKGGQISHVIRAVTSPRVRVCTHCWVNYNLPGYKASTM